MPTKQNQPATHTTRVLRLRLKDKHATALQAMARDVNFAWNFCNDLSFKVWQRERRFLSAYDIDKYTAGATREGLNLHSTTVQAISKELVTRRIQHRKVKLRWRVSRGSRRSLGWIPFKASALRYRNGQLLFSCLDKPLSLWDSYGLGQYQLGAGCISEDARGRWYINITVKIGKAQRSEARSAIGMDLGLKDFAIRVLARPAEFTLPTKIAPFSATSLVLSLCRKSFLRLAIFAWIARARAFLRARCAIARAASWSR
jgi:transposase